MSALNDYLEGKVQKSRILRDDAIDELAQLRADLQAAQDERDEAKAWHISLNAMIDRKNATIAEQARQLDEARIFAEYVSRRALWTESTLSHSAAIWLAANPAPRVEQP